MDHEILNKQKTFFLIKKNKNSCFADVKTFLLHLRINIIFFLFF